MSTAIPGSESLVERKVRNEKVAINSNTFVELERLEINSNTFVKGYSHISFDFLSVSHITLICTYLCTLEKPNSTEI